MVSLCLILNCLNITIDVIISMTIKLALKQAVSKLVVSQIVVAVLLSFHSSLELECFTRMSSVCVRIDLDSESHSESPS